MTGEARIAVFREPRVPLVIERVGLPVLGRGEVLVKVTTCTLCGSDLHSYEGRRACAVPTVLGHEIIGEVAEVGPGGPMADLLGRAVNPGDRVTWSMPASCGECFFCTHDLPQKCERLVKYGHMAITAAHRLNGGLGEYCHLVRGTSVIRLPEDLDDLAACPANCATATVAAGLRAGGGCKGRSVLIFGAGMLGLTACAMAGADGARVVIVSDLDRGRVELARRFGATHPCLADGGEEPLRRTVLDETDGRGADLLLDFTGSTDAIERGLGLLRIGGRCVLVGSVFPDRPLGMSAETIVRRMLTISGQHNYAPADLCAAVAFLHAHQHRFPFAELVSRVFSLDQVNEAFRAAGAGGVLRVAVRPWVVG